jgi:hypothetical protein
MEMDLKDYKKKAEAVMARPITVIGLDQREVGGKTIAVLYFSLEYKEIVGPSYRYEVFINGSAASGGIIS